VRNLLRENRRFFFWAALAGLALRLTFFFWIPRVTDDSLFYADLAKNWLQHGIYGISDGDRVEPTFSRLPGYPAFLAFVFAIAGLDHYKAVLLLQIAIDLGTCVLIADLARRCISGRAAKAAFLLTALCPFLANYAAAALTETLEIFFTALALDLAVAALAHQHDVSSDRALHSAGLWAACGLAIAACILLRPDGGILLAALAAYFAFELLRQVRRGESLFATVRAGAIVAIAATVPLGLWGLRNWHTLHRFELLAPRYANQEYEFVPAGFNRWTRTWIADYVSTEEIYWNVPGYEIDPAKLPSRAFDSAEQRERTEQLFANYNVDKRITPDLDAQFAALAGERIRAHPLRYYVELPAMKIADMWLRPRTELLPPDSRWFEFTDDTRWIVLAVGLGLINLFYVLAAFTGLIARHRRIAWVGLPLLYVLLRSLFLGTMENPESRYTLEGYPVLILLASVWWANLKPLSSHESRAKT
jgi:4-amino-4-deoxy-L-arabinose transferase-like glycosyltransferase